MIFFNLVINFIYTVCEILKVRVILPSNIKLILNFINKNGITTPKSSVIGILKEEHTQNPFRV